ncbi:MFS transporter [Gemmobacter serpentinus]|uniref:MFS transporter n=1 Tax=Gemmobacter serpentinus TaxID=2652247 RepID=UPI00124C69E9|nr:MFS transporter [Gemmobacter serpentinus]
MTTAPAPQVNPVQSTAFAIILSISLCHMLNDIMQSLLSAIYPMLKDDFQLDYWQIGLLTTCFQGTASLLQPAVGLFTDRKPLPKSLPIGMGATFFGLILLAFAPNYPMLLAGAALIGVGSAIFHPEASRVARMASGGRFGLAQSLFQVGGNFGTAIGPLLAAFIVVPLGRPSVAAFCVIALIGMAILNRVSYWYAAALTDAKGRKPASTALPVARNRVIAALVVLALLSFSKNIYMASISSYYTFYLIETFSLTTQQSQLMLFLFLGAVALGTVLGGPIGDRFGTLTVIWISVLGVLPFTLLLPHVGLFWTGVLSVIIGFILASAFPAIVVFAQELVPGRVGMVAGIFFGFAFGMGGIAAAVLGILADSHGIRTVYELCAWLPAIGLLTIFLPSKKLLRPGA